MCADSAFGLQIFTQAAAEKFLYNMKEALLHLH